MANEEKNKPTESAGKKKVGNKYCVMTTSFGIFYVAKELRDKIWAMKDDKYQNQFEMVKLKKDIYPANPVSKGSPVKLDKYAFPSSAVDISLNSILGFYHLNESDLTQEIERVISGENKKIIETK